jgi:pimeloyl-ACP methyl ester carboxylesterase
MGCAVRGRAYAMGICPFGGQAERKSRTLGGDTMSASTRDSHVLSIHWIMPLTVLLAAGVFVATAGAHEGQVCRATGEACFLGIDPDVYQMPLFGEYIQSGDEMICATTNWSPFPPEAFDIDFMRNFWAFGLNAAQQAETEAAAFFFVLTHGGIPAAPAADLSEVAMPSDFPGEVVSSLDSRTTRIEFEVPKTDFEKLGWTPIYLPVSYPPDPNPDVPWKLRGWYVRGDGISEGDDEGESDADDDDDDNVVHPLIILAPGFPYTLAYDQFVGGIDVGRQMRKAATYFVAKGFDVLIFDKRGLGYSEGIVDGMGEDVFRALDQLERGKIVDEGIDLTLTVITPDGRRLRGAAAAAEDLLGEAYTARTKPIVLRGFSYGSSQLQKAMAMNYSDLPVEYRFTRDADENVVVDDARMPSGNRGYNFKGIIAISGFQGSIKYETVPFFLALDALGSTTGHNGGVLKSSVYQSMDRWPAFLGLYSTNDFETADGAIDVFNERLKGSKDIKMVTGYHFGLASEEVDTYFAYESVKFAKRVIFRTPPMNNDQTTTYAEEVCASEQVVMDPATQSILDVPSRKIQRANRKVNRSLDEWMRKQ